MREIAVAPDKLAQRPLAEPAQRRPPRNRSEHLVGHHGVGLALDCDGVESVDLHVTADQAVGGFANQNGAWFGMLLQAGSQVRGIADRRIVRPQLVADRTDDHGASIDADPHGELASAWPELQFPLPQRPLNPERRENRSPRMILVRNRRKRQEAIAAKLVDGALVPVKLSLCEFEE